MDFFTSFQQFPHTFPQLWAKIYILVIFTQPSKEELQLFDLSPQPVENSCGKVENSFFLKFSFKVTNLIFLLFFIFFRVRHRMLTH